MIAQKQKTKTNVYAVGLNPITDDGYDFSITKNEWISLWLYITDIFSDLFVEQIVSNKEIIITESDAIKMAYKLNSLIASGEITKYINRNYINDHLFRANVNAVKRFSHFSALSGGFKIV